jgi:hypothetical protein
LQGHLSTDDGRDGPEDGQFEVARVRIGHSHLQGSTTHTRS